MARVLNDDSEFRRVYIEARLDQGCDNMSLIAQELGISRQAVAKTAKNMRDTDS